LNEAIAQGTILEEPHEMRRLEVFRQVSDDARALALRGHVPQRPDIERAQQTLAYRRSEIYLV
jgi:hypothetical protein